MDTPEVKPQPELVDTTADAKKIIETLLFITDRPVKPGRLAEVVETVSAKQVLAIIEELTREYAAPCRLWKWGAVSKWPPSRNTAVGCANCITKK